jgi:ABC-2 type transport system permease protein
MKALFAIARREVGAYFTTPIGWIVLCAFMFLTGIDFVLGLASYADAAGQMVFDPSQADQINVNDYLVSPLFDFTCVIALFLTPALTMRLIAEDRRSRAIELLLTSPISSTSIVLGKFLGALGFAGILTLSMSHYAAILFSLGQPDTGIVACNYLSLFLLLATFMAVGLFASALTENQVIALVIGFGANLMLWVLGWAGSLAQEGAFKTFMNSVSMLNHVQQLGKGTLHIEDIVYFLSFIGFFLFATVQRVEALRWR